MRASISAEKAYLVAISYLAVPRTREPLFISADISVVVFVWWLTALDWNRNRSVDETAEKFMELSVKAREEDKRYALQTTRAAAAALQRRGGIGL